MNDKKRNIIKKGILIGSATKIHSEYSNIHYGTSQTWEETTTITSQMMGGPRGGKR